MSVTPNRGLPLMEPSQAQPEVVYNAAMDILDMGGSGTSLEVETSGASPGVLDVAKIKFIGATVTEESGGVAVVTVDPSTGGGGGSLELTDGVHDLTGVTKITVSGATVGGSSPNATLTIAGGGGGGSNPFSVSPLTHDAGVQPFLATDNFEQANGTAVDTSGSRYAGATPWSWLNQGAATATQYDGSLVIVPDIATVRGNFLQQPVSGSTWSIRCKVESYNNGGGDGGGLFVRDSASGKLIVMQPYYNANILVQNLSGPTATVSNLYFGAPAQLTVGSDSYPLFLQITFNGTTLSFNYSLSGVEGTYRVLVTVAAATFLGVAPTHWGVYGGTVGAGTAKIIFDQFEQTA